MDISGCTIVRNATNLDFPLEASIRSLLPVVSELVVNVGASDDDTRDRVTAIGDPRIRILDTRWDFSRGPAMLADETQRAMSACRHSWGIAVALGRCSLGRDGRAWFREQGLRDRADGRAVQAVRVGSPSIRPAAARSPRSRRPSTS